MRLQLQLRQVCDVCKQTIDGSDDGLKIDIALFGADAYAVCPCCNQKSPKLTAAYKRRCDKYVKESNTP